MEARKCKYCSGAIPPEKRADTKFCSNSCKANYWEENKDKKQVPEGKVIPERVSLKVPEKPLDGLRGVIENKPQSDVIAVKEPSICIENEQITPVAIKRETQAYMNAMAKKGKAESEYLRTQNLYGRCKNYLQGWLSEKDKLKYTQPLNRVEAMNVDAMAIQANCSEEVWESDNRSERQKEMEKKMAVLNDCKYKLEQRLPFAKERYEAAELSLSSIPQYETVKQNSGISTLNFLRETGQIKLQQEEQQPEQAVEKQEDERIGENYTAIQTNSKLISSRELLEMNYKCLNFQGRWMEFFGLPAVVFNLAVHGKPGEGKSTFCIQFADYLAKNFGQVVYISGEEGFSKTLRDKVVNNKIDNPSLFFADINSYEEIKNEIGNNQFHFIFIDSLDTLRIDATRLRELREYYSQSAFITISQSTKDGKMRGSQEITHDTDIAVKVEDGVATTTKNRFHPRGTEFQVFPTAGKPANKMIDEPRNLI